MAVRNFARYCAMAISMLGAAASIDDVEVGRPLPPITVGNRGQPVRLDRIAGDAPIAVMLRATPITNGDCEPLYRASEKLAGDKVRLVVLNIGQQPCMAKPNIVFPADATQLVAMFPPGGSLKESWLLVVADPDGIVRVVKPFPGGSDGIGRATGMAATWEYGRQSFITNCGHCHGNDGGDTSNTGIKTLVGISRRLTGEQILTGGQQFGGVDMSAWSQSARDQLLFYIEGL